MNQPSDNRDSRLTDTADTLHNKLLKNLLNASNNKKSLDAQNLNVVENANELNGSTKIQNSRQNDKTTAQQQQKPSHISTSSMAAKTITTTSPNSSTTSPPNGNQKLTDYSKNQSELLKSINQTLKSVVQKQQQQKVHKEINLPQFFFPNGKAEDRKDDQEILRLAQFEFSKHDSGKIFKEDFENLVKASLNKITNADRVSDCNRLCVFLISLTTTKQKAIGLPKYWKILVYRACVGNSKLDYVTFSMFETLWTK